MRPLVGLDGGRQRPVGAVRGPDGSIDELVWNEIILRPASRQELEEFLTRYNGVVVRDGKARLLEGETPRDGIRDDTGWYLVRVDVRQSALDDLTENLSRADLDGQWVFSSEEVARLVAVVLRERDRNISPNFLEKPDQACEVCEHPTFGGNLDAATWWWMTEVVHAWAYLKYQGYPREGVPYIPVKVAVIDSGFDLDTNTGLPLGGNQDYFFSGPRPLQIDEVDGDWRVGGEHGYRWHGQSVFGICCAFARNSFGTAGIADGSEIKTLLIRRDRDRWTGAAGVYDALYNNADVINMSWSGNCGLLCFAFGNGNVLKANVGSARGQGAVVVSSAGNDGRDIGGDHVYPCELSGSICVGAIDQNANAQSYSNWGSVVDIWAPSGIRTTVTRDSAAYDGDDIGIDELQLFDGTSAAAPYVSGVVAMMKMLNASLSFAQIEQILADTSIASSDPKVTPGYIDAFAAVQAAKPNQSPIVTITAPVDGSTIGPTGTWFSVTVLDPEKPNTPYIPMFPTTLVITSDMDGHLCEETGWVETKGCSVPSLSSGKHVITAIATDAFGASSKNTIAISVSNTAPQAKITYPEHRSRYFVGQAINLRGWGFDPDEATLGLSWRSNISGQLSSGSDIWVNLPVGNHVITLTARDSRGAEGSDAIMVSVTEGAGYPTAKILRPASGSVFATGTQIRLVGEGIDPEEGSLSGASLRWVSDHDGDIGTGTTIKKTLSGPACGMRVHQITLEVTDSTGHSNTHTIQISIGRIC